MPESLGRRIPVASARGVRQIEALNAFKRLAKKSNMSFPKFLESRMIDIAKAEGEISADYETLGETRGGDRKSEGTEA